MKKIVQLLFLFSMLCVFCPQAFATPTQGALPEPANPQHWLIGHMDGDDFITDQTSSELNYYDHDPDENWYHGYMTNVDEPNPYKDFWLYLKFLVPLGSTWSPEDDEDQWATLDGTGTTLTGQSYEYSGSSSQFLEIWQTWKIEPNPSCEDFYLTGFFAGEPPLQLLNLAIKTECVVPVPATLWLLGPGLIGLVGLRRRFGR